MKQKMKDFLILWANTTSVRHINYHFTQLGEIVDYLENIFPEKIDILDADMENLDLLQIQQDLFYLWLYSLLLFLQLKILIMKEKRIKVNVLSMKE